MPAGLFARVTFVSAKCSVNDCDRVPYAHGLCRRHYDRKRQCGDPEGGDRRLSFNVMSPDFWEHVDRSGGPSSCWPWKHGLDSNGYGSITRKPRVYSTHRVAYTLAVGPIPDGIYVLHRCDNRPCCNPDHLFLGSHADNMADMKSKGRGRSGNKGGAAAHNKKLTQLQVDEIRRRYPGESQPALGREFGVSASQISRIVTGKRWSA